MLKSNALWVSYKKCCFEVTQLEYLGHIIFAKGIRTDPFEVAAKQQWPNPKNIGFEGIS